MSTYFRTDVLYYKVDIFLISIIQGVAPKQNKNSSVKKLLLAGIVLDIPENYQTVKQILGNLDLEGVEFMTQADMKLLMILVGKAGGKPTFGCPFCNSCKGADGELYCLGDLLQLYNDFFEAGGNRATQKDYENVVNPPLIATSPDKLILGTLALPELHLLLGSVDKLLLSIENCVFATGEEGLAFMDRFLKKVLFFVV